ncbi:putative ribonuclease H-like domain-containing protein [Tanacetum coccineum]
MDLETAQTTTIAKLPILKQGEYDMWRLRIEQYFEVQDYALWYVIENGNLFKPAAQTTTNADGTSTSLIPGPVTTKEKVQKKNDVKAESDYVGHFPSEHLMRFDDFFEDITDLDTMSFDDLYNSSQDCSNMRLQDLQAHAQDSQEYGFCVSSPSSLHNEPEFEGYRSKTSKIVSEDISNKVRESPDALLVEELVSDDKLEKKTVFPTIAKIEFVRPKQQEKPVRNQVNYNYSAKKAHPSAHRNMASRAVLMKTGLRPLNNARTGHPQKEDQGYVDSGCSRHMTGNMSYLSDFKDFDGGYVTFGGGVKREKITSKGTLKIASKDETSGILKNFITEIENLVDKKVKIIRCDNRTEFKNRVMNEFCEKKDIKREFSIARTPQQNGVVERRNRTLIEVARTMLADSKLSTTFWAEAINTACYMQNRVIIVKPHNKTLYELFRGRTPVLSFMRPFGCHVTILNTLDHLVKFDGKFDDGFFVGYLLTSKAFRVYNIRTKKVDENLRIRFLENKPIVTGDGPKWLFDIDSLTKSMNYVPVVSGTNSNDFAGSEESNGACQTSKETKFRQDYIVMPLWKDGSMFDSSSKNSCDDKPQPSSNAEKKDDKGISKAIGFSDQEKPESSTLNINTARPSVNTASANSKTGSLNINTVSPTVITTRSNRSQNVSDMFSLGRSATLEATHADLFGDETKIDMSNLTTSYYVSTTPNTRIHKDHSLDHVIGDIQSGVQTRGMTKNTNEHGFISAV